MLDRNRTGLIFGVFDGLHPGHEFLLREVLKLCARLVVVLTLPETALHLKGHVPVQSFSDREKTLISFDPRISVIPSDKVPGEWSIFKKINLTEYSVILGYDQTEIAQELKKMKIPFLVLPSFQPGKYKSSLLRP
jgi:cytidyltransferase-like protein